MYNLTDEQIDFISNDITKRGIETEDVRDNILDHVCCIIENDFSEDGDFNSFYVDTIARFYTKELREIEVETHDLITFKYYYAMKRTMKITAGLTSALIIAGGFFKFQHWPGAAVLLFSGIILFSLVFLPLNIVMKYRDDKAKENRLLMILGFILVITGSIGVLFKVMHFPYANILFYGSFLAFFVFFIPAYFFTKIRVPENKFNVIIQTTCMIAGCGMLFALFNLKGSKHIEDSVYSMDNFQVENVINLEIQNNLIFQNLAVANDPDLKEFRSITEQLNAQINSIHTNLIAQSNQISVDKARKLTSKDLQNPNDSKVIAAHFEKPLDELSYTGLVKSVEAYNAQLSSFKTPNALRLIPIDKLQMTNTIISVVLHQLKDIQVQLLSNENSFLNAKENTLAHVDRE